VGKKKERRVTGKRRKRTRRGFESMIGEKGEIRSEPGGGTFPGNPIGGRGLFCKMNEELYHVKVHVEGGEEAPESEDCLREKKRTPWGPFVRTRWGGNMKKAVKGTK